MNSGGLRYYYHVIYMTVTVVLVLNFKTTQNIFFALDQIYAVIRAKDREISIIMKITCLKVNSCFSAEIGDRRMELIFILKMISFLMQIFLMKQVRKLSKY